jgi:hypothetical protein
MSRVRDLRVGGGRVMVNMSERFHGFLVKIDTSVIAQKRFEMRVHLVGVGYYEGIPRAEQLNTMSSRQHQTV